AQVRGLRRIARFLLNLPQAPGVMESGMRGRILFGILLAVTIVGGYPYASLIVSRIIGTSTVVFTEHDGIQRTLVMGPDAPRPAWLPTLPRSFIVQAGHWVPSPGREIAGDVELLTHK